MSSRSKKPSLSRICRLVTCRKPFETTREYQVFCLPECRQRSNNEKFREVNPPRGIPTPTTGTISELRVAVDLLSKGFAVFRAMSPSCACDLAVLFESRLCRVEVKTGYRTAAGNLMVPKCDGSRFDVLAVVRGDEIIYQPQIEDWFGS